MDIWWESKKMQKDLIIKRKISSWWGLEKQRGTSVPPPNMLCMHANVTKVPHDFLPFHHVRAPPFPTRFCFRIISMFNYIICMAMLLSEIFESVFMISPEVTKCWIKETLIKAVEVFRETAIGDFDIAEILLDNQAGTCSSLKSMHMKGRMA